jgi:amicyanin
MQCLLGRALPRLLLSVVILLAVALVVLGAKGLAAESHEVDIDNYHFSPSDLTVPVGTTVTWVNHDEIPHTVTAADTPRSFKSSGLDTDDRFSVTFTKAGTYTYLCTVHPYMTGKIVVR